MPIHLFFKGCQVDTMESSEKSNQFVNIGGGLTSKSSLTGRCVSFSLIHKHSIFNNPFGSGNGLKSSFYANRRPKTHFYLTS